MAHPASGSLVLGCLLSGPESLASPGRGLRPARTATATPGKEAKRPSLHRDRQDHQNQCCSDQILTSVTTPPTEVGGFSGKPDQRQA